MCRGAAGPAAAAAESEFSADDADTLAAVLATDDVGEVDLIDVSYSITMATSNQRQKRQVLSGINFAVGVGGTGGMLAVLGRSGAGKSSLLNAISQRGTGTVGGRVLLNGIDMMRRDKLRVGYVEQGDELPGFLTPREHLMVYAQLSGQIASDAEQQERVDLILRVLELTRTSDRRIGILSTGRRRGLSGGERKRLAIASVLMFNPPVLCLDEYTSGLDSETALIVTSLLRRIATAGKKAVISTIHQPSSSSTSRLTLSSSSRTGPCCTPARRRARSRTLRPWATTRDSTAHNTTTPPTGSLRSRHHRPLSMTPNFGPPPSTPPPPRSRMAATRRRGRSRTQQ